MEDWTLDDSARVWVHVANRRMTKDEACMVQLHLEQFVAGWQAHGAALTAQALVVNGWMVVLAVDERLQQPTGCSIDASVSVLKQIEGLHPSMADLDVLTAWLSCTAQRLDPPGPAPRFRHSGPSARRGFWTTRSTCSTPQFPPLGS